MLGEFTGKNKTDTALWLGMRCMNVIGVAHTRFGFLLMR